MYYDFMIRTLVRQFSAMISLLVLFSLLWVVNLPSYSAQTITPSVCTFCPPVIIIINQQTTNSTNCCDPLCPQCVSGVPPIANCTGPKCPCRDCVCCYTLTVYEATTTTCTETVTESSLSVSTWTVSSFVNTLVSVTFPITFTQLDTVFYTTTQTFSATATDTTTTTTKVTTTFTSISTFYLTTVSTTVSNTFKSESVVGAGTADITEILLQTVSTFVEAIDLVIFIETLAVTSTETFATFTGADSFFATTTVTRTGIFETVIDGTVTVEGETVNLVTQTDDEMATVTESIFVTDGTVNVSPSLSITQSIAVTEPATLATATELVTEAITATELTITVSVTASASD